MGKVSKIENLSKFGFTNSKKKFGVNYWRFFFNGKEKYSSENQMFFVEFEMLNPYISPNECVLGFKSRVSISPENLQYALAGTQSAINLKTEKIVQPSYCVVRIGRFGKNGKQLCAYYPVNKIKFSSKPFLIETENQTFSNDSISGEITVTSQDLTQNPEFFCDEGSAKWNLNYVINKSLGIGFNNNGDRWFPSGLNSTFSGNLIFDDKEYVVFPLSSFGYVERYWGKTLMQPWFHISSSNLISNISGKILTGASFSIQGAFGKRVSFTGIIDDTEIIFSLDSKNKYNDVWQCSQMPEKEDIEENQLHWAVSIHNKHWILDVDVFCKITELFNRKLELPDGERKILNLLEGGTGTGEIKLYRKVKNNLEQIEDAKIENCICEFGELEENNF